MNAVTDESPPLDHEMRVVVLSDAQMDAIADRAATRVEDKFYRNVGRKLVEKILWLLGIVVVGLTVFLTGKGVLPK